MSEARHRTVVITVPQLALSLSGTTHNDTDAGLISDALIEDGIARSHGAKIGILSIPRGPEQHAMVSLEFPSQERRDAALNALRTVSLGCAFYTALTEVGGATLQLRLANGDPTGREVNTHRYVKAFVPA